MKTHFRRYINWVEYYLSVDDKQSARYYLLAAYLSIGWITQEQFTDGIKDLLS